MYIVDSSPYSIHICCFLSTLCGGYFDLLLQKRSLFLNFSVHPYYGIPTSSGNPIILLYQRRFTYSSIHIYRCHSSIPRYLRAPKVEASKRSSIPDEDPILESLMDRELHLCLNSSKRDSNISIDFRFNMIVFSF
jgi:hypothetical protein